MIDMEPIIDKFNKDGYVVVEPGVIFSGDEVQMFEEVFDKLLPSWKDGFVDPASLDSHKDPRFGLHTSFQGVQLNGCALRHRLYRGHGSVNNSLDNNILYGKRATIREGEYPLELLKTIENEKLLSFISCLLGCSHLSFHNGGIAAVYPGCTGEEKKFHIDTCGFTGSHKKPLSKDRFLVNAFMLLNDVDENLAPMRLVPGSHNRYQDINEKVSQKLKLPSTQNNIPQGSGLLWEELLPEDLEAPVSFTGKRGSICFMNSSLLHAATENRTKDKVRKVMIFNYSNREHTEFAKNYLDFQKNCQYVYKNLKDKGLGKSTFLNNSRLFTKKRFRRALIRAYVTQKEQYRVLISHAVVKLRKLFNKSTSPKSKMYLNLGPGHNWPHSEVICLGLNKDGEFSFDFNKPTVLPFENSRFMGVYSSHCLEYLQESQVEWWVSEVYRTLKSEGVFRVKILDSIRLIDAYAAKDASYFKWIRGQGIYIYDSWLRLVVRSFAEPIVDNYQDDEIYQLYQTKTHEEFLNFFSNQIEKIEDERLLVPHTNKSWWSAEKMIELMKNIGFSEAKVKEPNNSECKIFQGRQLNKTYPHISFIVEAIK
jgi:ubiquinone/menaquinone biosynthesis C-methylase UbiE